MLQLFWGNFSFAGGAASVTSQYTLVTSEWGQAPLRYDAVFGVRGYIDGSGPLDLSAKELLWREALSKPNQDLLLVTETGAVTSSSIRARESVSGTRVRNIRFTESKGGEFINRRTMEFEVTATYAVRGSQNAVVAWTESVTIIGNSGPDRVWRFPVNAPAIREIVTLQSLVRATQTGVAIGHTKAPTIPKPIWPDYIVNPEYMVSRDTPKYLGKNFVDYPVRWSYSFQRGDGPLVGLPSLPPGV